MTSTPEDPDTREKQLQAALCAYMQAEDEGKAPSREELLRQHPDLADDLADFLDDQDKLRRAAQLPESLAPGGSPGQTVGAGASPGTVPYFGDYELLGKIAQGGMGVVYRARQVSLNRPVALKMILAGRLASEEDVRRFRQEAEAAASLDHPNIVPIYEVGEHDGQHYFAMKLIEGDSLARGASGRQPAAGSKERQGWAARLVATVARAVHHAHQGGILHRDLKPANVLLDADGRPHVTDFGLARRMESSQQHTQTGAVIGTIEYMAPEQAAGHRGLTTAADVYGLGAILYELLTGRPPFGRPPFGGEDVLDTLLAVRERAPRPPRELNPRLDRDLETVCLKCLRKEPAKRYKSAEAVAEDLERWLGGEPIQARPVGPAERLWAWCRRNRAAAALIGVLAVATVSASLLTFWALAEKGRADREASTARNADEEAKENQDLALKRKEAAEFQAFRAEDARHTIQVGLALRAWEQHDVPAAERVLEEIDPQFRNTWETRFVRHLCQRKVTSFRGHTAWVTSVAFGPDGKHIASGSEDKTVKVWDTQTGKEKLSLKGHASVVTSVAFSPDGKRIASVSGDGTVKVWDTQTGKELFFLKRQTGSEWSVTFSPDGKHIASGGNDGERDSGNYDGSVKVWDTHTGEEELLLKGHTGCVISVAFSPDGKRVASASSDNSVKVWDTRTGKELFSLKGNTNGVRSVAFSPDSKRIATGSDSGPGDGRVKIWDTQTGKELLSLTGQAGGVTSVAFSPDGTHIASGNDWAVQVWDTQTGKELFSLKGHEHWVTSVAFSPDGKRIASGSGDKTVKVWDTQTGKDLRYIEGHSSLWVLERGAVAFVHHNKYIATGSADGTVRIRNHQMGKELVSLKGHAGSVTSVVFSLDSKRLATGSEDKTVKVWDTRTGKELLSLKGHEHSVTSVAFSPDAKHIASGSEDKMVKVWDTQTGKELFSLMGHEHSVASVAFSPDGKRVASGSIGGTVKVWDTQTGKEKLSLNGHTDWVTSVVFSPDGKRIASGSKDSTVKVWDTQTGQEKLSLNGHTGWVTSVAFSPDGNRISSTDNSQLLRVWDAGTGP